MEARDWDGVGASVARDVVVDWPHTGERIVGRASYVAVNREYPEGWHVHVLRVVPGDAVTVAEVRVEHGEHVFLCIGFYETARDEIVRATEYWVTANGERPPVWRAKHTQRR
jgi:hypothetical protein